MSTKEVQAGWQIGRLVGRMSDRSEKAKIRWQRDQRDRQVGRIPGRQAEESTV